MSACIRVRDLQKTFVRTRRKPGALGALRSLARPSGANGPCIATAVVAAQLDESAAVTDDGLYYLVRGTNACGAGPWGSDSFGTPEPACP